MLAFTEYSQDLENKYLQSKKLASSIIEKTKEFFRKETIAANKNLLKTDKKVIIVVKEGIFKLGKSEKLLRLYSEGDLILLNNFDNFKLYSEFRTEIDTLDYGIFWREFSHDSDLIKNLIEYQLIEKEIVYALLEESIAKIFQPKFNIQKYKKGTHIIKKDEESVNVYHLMSGKVGIFLKDVKVGEIKNDEIFGEFGFFAQTKRTADAIAETDVIVNILNRNDFAKIIKTKPELSIKITEVLSKRIIRLNEELAIYKGCKE